MNDLGERKNVMCLSFDIHIGKFQFCILHAACFSMTLYGIHFSEGLLLANGSQHTRQCHSS